MAAPFQVNIVISAGVDFNQQFTLMNPDKSPTDISGFTFSGSLSKYSRALNAIESTSTHPVYNRVYFTAGVVDAYAGIYSISLTAEQTRYLLEGKYIYSVVCKNLDGESIPTVQGLAFVDIAFGAVLPEPTPPPTPPTSTNASLPIT